MYYSTYIRNAQTQSGKNKSPGDAEAFAYMQLIYADSTVFANGNAHTFLYIIQKIITKAIHNRHLNIGTPDRCQNGSGRSKRVNGFTEEHASRLTAHSTGTVENKPARC